MYEQVVLAAGSVDGVVGGVAPDWGPLSGLGTQAKVLIGVVMACVAVACLVMALVGAAKQRVGGVSGNSMRSEDGKSLLISGVAGMFIMATLGAIMVIVYAAGSKV